jgi:hypothetical protein
VYGSRQAVPEYLVLIDRASFRDQRSRVIDEMLNRAVEDGVFVDRYYFDGDPRTCRGEEAGSSHLSLAELAAKHPSHRLLVFTDATKFKSPTTGQLEVWLDRFSPWRRRAIFTPEPTAHWGYHEWALANQGFVVLPASTRGLGAFVERIHAGAAAGSDELDWPIALPKQIRERTIRWLERHPPSESVVDELLRELRFYLGEAGFYWLAACAVYPLLQWELVLYFGLMLGHGNERLLDEKRLLAMTRLPWFRYGTMPDWLRSRLIAEMSAEQEERVREMLNILLVSSLHGSQEGFTLEIAEQDFGLSRAGFKRLIQNVAHEASDDSPIREYVFLDFLIGGRASRLTPTLPRTVRSAVFRKGQAALGVRPLAVFSMVGVLALGLYAFIPTAVPDTGNESFLPRFTGQGDSVAYSDSSAYTCLLQMAESEQFKGLLAESPQFVKGDDASDQDIWRLAENMRRIKEKLRDPNSIETQSAPTIYGWYLGFLKRWYHTRAGIDSSTFALAMLDGRTDPDAPIELRVSRAPPAAAMGSFSITVVTNRGTRGERRVPDATVFFVDGRSGDETGFDGNANGVVDGRIGAGMYRLVVTAPGYSTGRDGVLISPGRRAAVTIELKPVATPRTGRVTGVVAEGGLEVRKGVAIAGATVSFANAAGTRSRTQTDRGGRFAKDLPAGTYTVTATAQGYEPWSDRIRVEVGQTVEINPLPEKIPERPRKPEVYSEGKLQVRGTYSCDLDRGAETQDGSDFWWQQATGTERYLTPRNGARFMVLGQDRFEDVSYERLTGLSYSADRISGSIGEDVIKDPRDGYYFWAEEQKSKKSSPRLSRNLIPDGTTVAYITNEGRYGKFEVIDYGYDLTIRWITYDEEPMPEANSLAE